MLSLTKENICVEEMCRNRFFRFPDIYTGILLTRKEWDDIPQDIKDEGDGCNRRILDYPVLIEDEWEEDVIKEIKLRMRLNSMIRSVLNKQLNDAKDKSEEELRYIEEALEYVEGLDALF
jgi:hypothetical protein